MPEKGGDDTNYHQAEIKRVNEFLKKELQMKKIVTMLIAALAVVGLITGMAFATSGVEKCGVCHMQVDVATLSDEAVLGQRTTGAVQKDGMTEKTMRALKDAAMLTGMGGMEGKSITDLAVMREGYEIKGEGITLLTFTLVDEIPLPVPAYISQAKYDGAQVMKAVTVYAADDGRVYRPKIC